MILVAKVKDMPDTTRKEFIDKVYSNVQNQGLETANIENDHMLSAIRVCHLFDLLLNINNFLK